MTDYRRGQTVTLFLTDMQAGLAGTVTIEIRNALTAAVLVAATTAGITEDDGGSDPSDSTYTATVALPIDAPLASYIPVWDPHDGGTEIVGTEDEFTIVAAQGGAQRAAMFGENALLLDITAPGAPDETGDVANPGAQLWAGSAPCYLRRERRRTMAGDRMTLRDVDALYVRGAVGVPVLYQAGDQQTATTVLVRDNRTATPAERRFRVGDVTNRAGGTQVDSVRLELEDPR